MSTVPIWTRCLEVIKKLTLQTAFLIGGWMLSAAIVVDWITGPDVASAVFYLPIVILITWKGGRWIGLGAALTCGIAWFTALRLAHPFYHNELIPVWNALVRTTTFCLVSVLLSEVIGRKRAESKARQMYHDLQKQTAILESILSSMGDGVVVADAQGRLLHINPIARRTLDLPPEGRDVAAWLESQQYYLPNDLTATNSRENPLLRAVRGESVDAAEMFLPHANEGEGIWLLVTGRPLLDAAGQVTGGVIVFSDISARKQLERQIAEASDREQRRLGEDLHDGLCQQLVCTALAARVLAGRLSDQSLPEAKDATEIRELLGTAISQARDVARGLSLVPLESGGLACALEELATQVHTRHGIACQFVDQTAIMALEEPLGTTLYRIAQEAVNNAIKHAHAHAITVTLAEDARQIRLTIEDDGVGFQPSAAPGRGMGLHIMNYRARMVGAELNVAPRAGGGTLVVCSVRQSKRVERKGSLHGERN